MKILGVRECQNPACPETSPHEDDEGLRLFGVPSWLIAFLTVVAMGVGMLAYTAAVR